MQLVSITKSDRVGKKWKATFANTSKGQEIVHFGAVGYQDYTSGATDAQKIRYKSRHTNSRENHNKPNTAASLSYHILWGDSKSRLANIKSFKQKFNI